MTCLPNARNINPQTQAGSQGAPPRWAELVWHSGHLYARPIPIAELAMINFPPPATAALAHTPQALPPAKVGLHWDRSCLHHPRLSFAERGGQVDSKPLGLGWAAVVPPDPGTRGLLPARASPTRRPAAG